MSLKNKSCEPTTSQRVYVFIDAANIWKVFKAKRSLFDYRKLKKFLIKKFNASIIKIFYYTAYPAAGTREYDLTAKHNFFTYLKKGLGFTVRKKELKRIWGETSEGISLTEKGNMNVEMTIDAIHHLKDYDVALFFTGDSDFLALISYLRKRGKKVYIFSTKNSVAKELRTGNDNYFDLLEIKADIWGKAIRHRPK